MFSGIYPGAENFPWDPSQYICDGQVCWRTVPQLSGLMVFLSGHQEPDVLRLHPGLDMEVTTCHPWFHKNIL